MSLPISDTYTTKISSLINKFNTTRNITRTVSMNSTKGTLSI